MTKFLEINTLLSMVLFIRSKSTHHQCLEHPLPLEKCTCRCKNVYGNAVLHDSTSVTTTRGISQQFHGEMANTTQKPLKELQVRSTEMLISIWGNMTWHYGDEKPLGVLNATLGSQSGVQILGRSHIRLH